MEAIPCNTHGVGGARAAVTLLYALKDREAKLGMVSLCLGEGKRYLLIVKIVQCNQLTIRLGRRKLWNADKL